MSALNRKKRSRGAYRSHCMKLEDVILHTINNYDPEDNQTLTKVNALKTNYETQLEKIRILDDDIADLIDEENIEEELAQSLLAKDKSYEILATINSFICKLSISTTLPSPSTTSASSLRVRLPKLELKRFDGNILNWQTFWDRFSSSVHNQENISDIDKFSYLKGLLSDSANECISGLTLSSGNYEAAVNILKDRYANPQVIISAHMDALVKLASVKNSNNVVVLRKMYDQVESSIRNLKSLGIDPGSYGALLVPLLNEKLPTEFRVIIARKFVNDVWDLEEMLKCFKEELQAKERCLSICASNLLAQEDKTFSQSEYTCIYCKNQHSPSRCINITDPKRRIAILRRKGRCFLCLKSGHITRNCPSLIYAETVTRNTTFRFAKIATMNHKFHNKIIFNKPRIIITIRNKMYCFRPHEGEFSI